MFLLRMKVRLSPERITGSLYRRRPDMSTSAGMPAQPKLFVPDAAKHLLREMRGLSTSSSVKVALHGRDALELVFEDGSDAPFVIHMLSEQCDRLLPENKRWRGFVVTVRTRGGNQLRYPGKYRVVENLPDVSPWSEH